MTHWRENFTNYHILHENFELLGGAPPLLFSCMCICDFESLFPYLMNF